MIQWDSRSSEQVNTREQKGKQNQHLSMEKWRGMMTVMQTSTTGAIYAAGKDNTKLTYDTNAKIILSNRYVLAYILKYVTKEFKNSEITDIIHCIENTQIGEESVLPNTSSRS